MRLTNISWSLAGLAAPLIFAAITIPALVKSIGIERFGLLSLAWGLIGFSGIFDLGIGRATTQTIARLRGCNQLEQAQPVLKTASVLSLYSGLAGAVLLVLAVIGGAHTFIKYSQELGSEVPMAAFLVALTIPIQSMSAMFRGVNEAFEHFREISIVRIGLGIANFLGPYLVSLLTTHLAALVSTLLISRLLAFFLFRKFAFSCLLNKVGHGQVTASVSASPEIARQLLVFGGWFTVSSLISPVLVQADRFFIGALISAAAIATYTIPYEVVTQSLILVGAISSVAFPSLSALVNSEPEKSNGMFRAWLLRVAAIMLVITSLLAASLPFILPWWIGPTLPADSVLVGQILCVGIFANSIGAMYFAYLHAHGRADITAKLHIIELPLFLSALYLLVTNFGVIGAAICWAGRMVLDTSLLWAANSLFKPTTIAPEPELKC